jgi:SAM-dependent methyltransferase
VFLGEDVPGRPKFGGAVERADIEMRLGREPRALAGQSRPAPGAKARDNAASIGARNVEFRLGELEHLPIADNTADIVISNCVINLVPDKEQLFREAFRVLKHGGRLAVSDVINTAPLPAGLRADPALLCGCVAGAAPAERIEAWLHGAGFVDVSVTANLESREMVAGWASGRGVENYIASAMVEARKP